MSGFFLYAGTAFALMLVIEGLIYALFTDSARQMMNFALALPPEKLRTAGLFMAGAGACLVWLMHVLVN